MLDILDAEQPVDALREFIAARKKKFSVPDGQIALGAAQLMLLTIAREHRGGPEVRDVIDLIVSAWKRFPEPGGFHAQEFLRNALVAAGDDTDLVDALIARVPRDASPELVTVVSRAQTKEVIPVDVAPYVRPVRNALEEVRATLEELGGTMEVAPPAELDAVLASERAAHIQLPNDFRALLTITNGCTLFDREFFGVDDYRTETALAKRARAYLSAAPAGIDECIPLANWGQGNDWLLWDPHGHRRRGAPGYVVMSDDAESTYDDLVSVLEDVASHARDALSTN
ncbi:MAG TPA: SMI1/KNR4 family protein [Kofleriaceae bacterium]